MSFGSNIKNRRKNLNLTQTELAEKMGFRHKSAISHYENDCRKGSIKTAKRFAEALNCSIEELLNDTAADTESKQMPPRPSSLHASNQKKHSRASSFSSQTRIDLTEAFWKLYEKKNIQKIKVHEICSLAGYNRSSFYRYFADVYDVLEQIENKIIHRILEESDESLLSEDIGKTVTSFLQIWDENSKYIKVFADKKTNSHFQTRLTQEMIAFYRQHFIFSKDAEVNEYLMEYQVTGAIAAMMRFYRKEERQMSLEELIRMLLVYKAQMAQQISLRRKGQ